MAELPTRYEHGAAREFGLGRAFLVFILNNEFVARIVEPIGHTDVRNVSPNRSREKLPPLGGFQPPSLANDLRKLLNALADLKYSPQQWSPLQKICEAGSEYGLGALEKAVAPELFSRLRPKPKRRIKNHLRRTLARVTRPCFELEFKAFRSAYEAIYSRGGFATPKFMQKKFLGERPYDRLSSLFTRFPVLTEVWSRLICQCCDSVSELLARVEADKHRISRVFFRGQPVGKIISLLAGLSDPHNDGRAVMRIQFAAGPIIYKPRSGQGEQQWFRLVRYFNSVSLRPKLTAPRVLCRDGYCWMEEVKFASCKDQGGVRRFYTRMGAMIAAACLVKAVDCHRDNVIASGEHPVLVDAETLWHEADRKKAKTVLDSLHATGFLPASDKRWSYQYRSSALGRTRPGKHTPHRAGKPLRAAQYEREIVTGFRRTWICLLGTKARRLAFSGRLQRLRNQKRRRIYWSTEMYDAIRDASIQPAALRSGIDRDLLIARLCARSGVSQTVIRKEIDALRRLDIPYFVERGTATLRLPEQDAVPAEITEALQRAVRI
jgi:lantibiotic modifying enzyme